MSRLPAIQDDKTPEPDDEEKSKSVVENEVEDTAPKNMSQGSESRLPDASSNLDSNPSDDATDNLHLFLDEQVNGYPLVSDAVAGCFNGCDTCQSDSHFNGSKLALPFNKRHGLFRKRQTHSCENCDGECECDEGHSGYDAAPKFKPDLGHRDPFPVIRGDLSSSTEKFSFEEDGEFPPAKEILANSHFFCRKQNSCSCNHHSIGTAYFQSPTVETFHRNHSILTWFQRSVLLPDLSRNLDRASLVSTFNSITNRMTLILSAMVSRRERSRSTYWVGQLSRLRWLQTTLANQ